MRKKQVSHANTMGLNNGALTRIYLNKKELTSCINKKIKKTQPVHQTSGIVNSNNGAKQDKSFNSKKKFMASRPDSNKREIYRIKT